MSRDNCQRLDRIISNIYINEQLKREKKKSHLQEVGRDFFFNSEVGKYQGPCRCVMKNPILNLKAFHSISSCKNLFFVPRFYVMCPLLVKKMTKVTLYACVVIK